MTDNVTRPRLEKLAREFLGEGAYVGRARQVRGAWKVEAVDGSGRNRVEGTGMSLRHAYRDLAGALILRGT